MWRFKKNVGRNPGAHPYTPEDMKRVGWCMNKNISVAVCPYWEGQSDEWKIEIKINKKIHLDPAVYSASEAYKKMYEYYKYYYDKYNKISK